MRIVQMKAERTKKAGRAVNAGAGVDDTPTLLNGTHIVRCVNKPRCPWESSLFFTN